MLCDETAMESEGRTVSYGSGPAMAHVNPLVAGLQQVVCLSVAAEVPKGLLRGSDVKNYFKMSMG